MITLKPIPGFSGYFASSDGRIWTQKRKGGNDRNAGRILTDPRPLKAHLNGSGYLTVNLDLNGKTVSRRVHRLVLETFVGPAPDGFYACHYPDATKSNNNINNLRWGSPADNAQDRYRDTLDQNTKRCRSCDAEKNKTDFYNDSRASDGLQSQCKKCHMSLSLKTRDMEKKNQSNCNYMRRKRADNPKYGR